MNLKLKKSDNILAEAVIYPFYEDENLENTKDSIIDILKNFKERNRFKGSLGEVVYFTRDNNGSMQYGIFLGLGKKEEIDSEKLRIASSKALKKAEELKVTSLEMQMINAEGICLKRIVKSIAEGMILGDYKFDRYKTDKKEKVLKEVFITGIEEELEKAQEALEEAEVLTEATILARELVNEPANVLYPEELAKRAERAGETYGFSVDIFKEDKIEKLGMKAFLEVAKGSSRSPRLIVMRYFGNEENKEDILGLVGKGLTYDSGGYSIKPTDGMVTMKSDMGGAAAVIGAISAIAKMKLKINVVGVVAACENMISGKAYKPGDIIGSMAGKTIEVLNTDAEGRLTLVDAVHYIIDKEKASKVIDLATLTGAVLIALGTDVTGVVTNNADFYEELEAASELSGEKVWQLPSFEEYKELIKSDIADLKNIGGRYAGSITAGLFIGEFVQDKPWIHMDIAGTAWSEKEKNYISKGGTGAGVRTLYYLAKKKSGCCHR